MRGESSGKWEMRKKVGDTKRAGDLELMRELLWVLSPVLKN